MTKSFLFIILFFISICLSLPLSNPVNTNYGSIQGLEGFNFLAFLGIPYAQAPINNLRFSSPIEPLPFSSTYQATSLSHACPQANFEGIYNLTQSEDCLYLNIFTPKSITSNSKLPVLFFIHGGGWQTGSGMIPLYFGNSIANDNTDIILVTINYRLGALGWLVSPAINDQNFGFKDQQMAMKWVYENIQYFGGDSSRITITGQSAGGMSVYTHLTSPSSYSYFSQAIMQSAPPLVTYPSIEDRYTYGNQFSRNLGCGVKGNLACFQSKSVQDIINSQSQIIPLPLPIPLDENPNSILFWMPVIDNNVILGSPQSLINTNQTAHVPVAWGTTRNETAGYLEFLPSLLPAEYDVLLALLFGNKNITSVKNMYPATTSEEIYNQLSQITCDYIFTCSIRYSARMYANSGNPLHKYVFLHPPSSDPRCNGTVSHCANIQETCHGAELDFIFNSAEYAGANFTSDEEILSSETLNYWVSFVKGEATQSGWPQYIPQNDNNLALDIPTPYILNNWRKEQCDFWDSWGYYGTTTDVLESIISHYINNRN